MPQRARLPMFLSLLTLTVLIGCGAFCAKSAAYYARLHRRNAAQSVQSLPTEPAPDSATRLMVFAPHCDDETLGNAGLIQQTAQAGGMVRVGILTSGDAFPAAAQRQFRSLRLRPADYSRFAAMRQQESRNALGGLGVSAANVRYFGYPDRGLMPLWSSHWMADTPYFAPNTRRGATDPALSAFPDAPYCGQSLLENIKAELRNFRPTLITVTHPAEDHPDHAAASAFVALALRELQNEPESAAWAKSVHLRYYLVHCGDWPAPPAQNPALAPPAALMRLATAWRCLPLTTGQTKAKAQAIARYPTQTAMMGNFLQAFARSNEIYGAEDAQILTRILDSANPLPDNAPVWKRIAPAVRSPLADNLAREMEGGGDIAVCRACRDSKNFYLQIETREAVSPRFAYRVAIRGLGKHGESGAEALTLNPSPPSNTSSRTLTFAVPLTQLEIKSSNQDAPTPFAALTFRVETSLAGVPIDQTGIVILSTK